MKELEELIWATIHATTDAQSEAEAGQYTEVLNYLYDAENALRDALDVLPKDK